MTRSTETCALSMVNGSSCRGIECHRCLAWEERDPQSPADFEVLLRELAEAIDRDGNSSYWLQRSPQYLSARAALKARK
jgi:hypothetical protein